MTRENVLIFSPISCKPVPRKEFPMDSCIAYFLYTTMTTGNPRGTENIVLKQREEILPQKLSLFLNAHEVSAPWTSEHHFPVPKPAQPAVNTFEQPEEECGVLRWNSFTPEKKTWRSSSSRSLVGRRHTAKGLWP